MITGSTTHRFPCHLADMQVWLVAGIKKVFYKEPNLNELPVGDLGKASAHWVTRDLLAWRTDTEDAQVTLHFSESASLESEGGKLLHGMRQQGAPLTSSLP